MGAKERLELMDLSGQKIKCVTIETERANIHIYFITSETPEAFTLESQLLEESQLQNIGHGYSIRFDRNNYQYFTDPNKDHIHLYKNGNEIIAVNRDGSGHDGASGYVIPSYAAKAILQKYPDFRIPANRVLESLSIKDPKTEEEILYLLDNQNSQVIYG